MDDNIYLGDLNSNNNLDNNMFLNQFIIDDENDFKIFNGTLLNTAPFGTLNTTGVVPIKLHTRLLCLLVAHS